MDRINEILEMIYKNPIQKKKIEKFLFLQDEKYFQEFNDFIENYDIFLKSQGLTFENVVEGYLKLCSGMLRSQMKFIQTGEYPQGNATEVYQNFYAIENEMKSHMFGIALSQFVWKSHYKIYTFIDNYFKENKKNIKTYLEIGPGHGLFLKKALDYLPDYCKFVALDISETSIKISKSILDLLKPNSKIEYITKDILEYNTDKKFDFIMMGEVLEHVNHPDILLLKTSELLSEKGKLFISTCVDCPSIDHVYHYKTVDDIRKMIFQCNLDIEDELISPAEDLPIEEIVAKKITINYCAILKNSNTK